MECEVLDFNCHLTVIVTEIKLLFIYLFEQILSGFTAFFALIPVPDFLNDVGSFSLPPSMIYFTDLFMVPEGIAIIVSAYTLRFLIKRIPFIG